MARKDMLEIRSFDGVSDFVSKEDRQVSVMQKLVNLRPNHKLGRAIKRNGYTEKLTSGLTNLQQIKEYTDKNGEVILFVIDNDGIERSVVSAGSYGALSAVSNDERTAGATVDGDNAFPAVVNATIRSGAGVNASTDIPFWYGYIKSRNRFNDAVTISAGRYLVDQLCSDTLSNLLNNSYPVFAEGEAYTSGKALTEQSTAYTLYIAPVIDGQRCFYDSSIIKSISLSPASFSEYRLQISLRIDAADVQKFKRVTDLDLFIKTSKATTNSAPDDDNNPAYFLERISLNDNSDHYLEIQGTLDNTGGSEKITITNFANWQTHRLTGIWIKDLSNDKDYLIDNYTVNGSDIEIEVNASIGDAITDSGLATLQFYSGWYALSGNYIYTTFYDGYYKTLGSEMYAYLNIPTGDTGLPDQRYKFSAWNGNRLLIGGRPNDERNITYFSVTNSPDIIPAQNVIIHSFPVTAVSTIGQDFLVFGKNETDRIRIVSNAESYQDDQYANFGCIGQNGVVRIDDNMLAVMSYKGLYLITNRQAVYVGQHLQDWWETLTDAQKEACVLGYNHDHNEVWMSFPTYTDSDYTSGLIIVFDLEAYQQQRMSPFWFVNTDMAVKAMDNSQVQKLIAGSSTKLVDMNTQGTETVATLYKMKLLNNPIPNKKVRWDKVQIDCETSDSITASVYFDGESSPVTLALNADKQAFIRYLKKTLELEISTAASTNNVEHLGNVLYYNIRKVQ